MRTMKLAILWVMIHSSESEVALVVVIPEDRMNLRCQIPGVDLLAVDLSGLPFVCWWIVEVLLVETA